MNLEELREEINGIDKEILALFLKRMDAAVKVAEYKIENHLPVLNETREEEILKKVSENAGKFGGSAKVVFSALMDVSREAQHRLLNDGKKLRDEINVAVSSYHSKAKNPTIACQGVPGAYSHEAALKVYKDANIQSYERWEDVFDAVAKDEVDFGVVPVENSYAGSVTEVYDLILKHKLTISGAIGLSISHCLMANEGADFDTISKVYSHPQALSQCKDYIKEKGFVPEPCLNTAVAAKIVAEKGSINIAAIGSVEAAEIHGLVILEKDIQSSKQNCTRFVFISKKLEIEESANRISLAFSLPHVTGSLHRTLARFSIAGLSLTKIESRPLPNSSFEYLFYLDFNGNLRDSATVDLLCSLYTELPTFTFLGNYLEI